MIKPNNRAFGAKGQQANRASPVEMHPFCLRHLPRRGRSVLRFLVESCGTMLSTHSPTSEAGALWILSNVPHSSEGNRRANLPLRGRRRRRRQKGCISIARRAVCLFSTGEARLYGFAAGRRHTKWGRKAPYLASAAILYNSLGWQALNQSGRRSRSRTEPLAPRAVRPGGAINPRPQGVNLREYR